MSPYPAYAMSVLCIVGGVTGFVKSRSTPSLVAGVSIGLLYLWSAESIRRGNLYGVETAIGASALLFLSSLPRLTKPVPAILALSSAASGIYYAANKYA